MGAFVFVTVTALVFLSPYIWSVSISFQEPGDVFAWPIRLIPDPPTIDNYLRLWTEVSFGRWLLNSTLVVTVVTASNLIFASMAGYAFARLEFPGRQVLFYAFLATMMIPGHVTLVPKFMLLNSLGLVNTYGGLILPNVV
ncbi:MAG: carbohydrate ABC transporter permease, partial [Myxococcota bacterium]